MDLPRCPRWWRSNDALIVLDSWQTPAFAQFWLDHGGLADKSQRNEPESQIERYTAIAERRDWTGQGRRLVWRVALERSRR
jgi:hypothetical protein